MHTWFASPPTVLKAKLLILSLNVAENRRIWILATCCLMLLIIRRESDANPSCYITR